MSHGTWKRMIIQERADQLYYLVTDSDPSARVARTGHSLLILALLMLLCSCSARDHAIAEREGNRISSEKAAVVDRFRREQLVQPDAAVSHREPTPSEISAEAFSNR
jgi:hypothetical protein